MTLAFSGSAAAAGVIQIDTSPFPVGGQACVTAGAGTGGVSDGLCTEALTFDHSASISVASATHTSSIIDSPGGVLVDAHFTTSASASATTSGNGAAWLARSFFVTGASVPYKITGDSTVSDLGASQVKLTHDCSPGECPVESHNLGVAASGPFTYTGTLAPSPERYRLYLSTGCDNSDVAGCTGTANIRVELGSPAPPVVIGSGPSGTVASRSAHFEFTTVDPNPPPGHLQCRVDGQPAFTTCNSPFDLADLSDGQHTFGVRYDADDADPSAETDRIWTVDATPPAVAFDSAPSGDRNPSSAQITFHSTEPTGAAFRCQLDGGTAFDCSSPQSLFGLSEGPHNFTVTASDQVGNTSVPATVSWTVDSADPTSIACPAGGDAAAFGPVRVVARAEDACFVDEIVDGVAAKVSRGLVTLNGIPLTPAPGTRIIVAPGLGDGTVRTDGPVTVGFGSRSLSLPSLNLPSLGLLAGTVTKSISFGENALTDIAGLKAVPVIQLELKPDNGGQVTVTFRLKLPKVAFRQLPGREPQVEGVTVEVAPTFSNDKGLTVAGRIKLATIYLFGTKIKDLDLALDLGTGVFDGSFGLEFGAARFGVEPTLTFALTIAPTASQCGLRRLALQPSNLNKNLGDGIYLQRYGGSLDCVVDGGNRVVKLTANGGVSGGPRVALGPLGEVEAISVDGTVTLAIPLGPQPPELFSLAVSGVGKIVDIPVTEQTITYKPPASIFATGKLDFAIGGYGAQLTYGEQGSFISEGLFNIEAAGTVNLFGFQYNADAVYSSTGFAVCFGAPGERVGFGKRWLGDELTAFVVCDVGPFRASPARSAKAGDRGFTVREKGHLTVVAAEGAGAPPSVTLTGPGGEKIVTPAGSSGISTKDVLLVQDPERHTTFVVLFNPAAGRWTVSPAASGAALRRMRVATGLPPLRITAKVTGKGPRRVLRWNARGLAGQRLQLVERSAGGARLLKTTSRSAGLLRFKPDAQLGAARTIEAIAFNGKTPRASSTVARYRVATPRVPKGIRAIRLRKGVLSWQPQTAASRYEIALQLPDGRTIMRKAQGARLTIKGLPKAGTVVASVVGINPLGRPGPVGTAKLKLG